MNAQLAEALKACCVYGFGGRGTPLGVLEALDVVGMWYIRTRQLERLVSLKHDSIDLCIALLAARGVPIDAFKHQHHALFAMVSRASTLRHMEQIPVVREDRARLTAWLREFASFVADEKMPLKPLDASHGQYLTDEERNIVDRIPRYAVVARRAYFNASQRQVQRVLMADTDAVVRDCEMHGVVRPAFQRVQLLVFFVALGGNQERLPDAPMYWVLQDARLAQAAQAGFLTPRIVRWLLEHNSQVPNHRIVRAGLGLPLEEGRRVFLGPFLDSAAALLSPPPSHAGPARLLAELDGDEAIRRRVLAFLVPYNREARVRHIDFDEY